jgi:hypothetical protein
MQGSLKYKLVSLLALPLLSACSSLGSLGVGCTAPELQVAPQTATSSHLVRVELPLNVVDDLFSDFDRAMRNLTHSALSDDWFLHKNDWGAESKKFIDKYKESKTLDSNECDGSPGKCSEAE